MYTCNQGILPNKEKNELETPVVMLRLQMPSVKSFHTCQAQDVDIIILSLSLSKYIYIYICIY